MKDEVDEHAKSLATIHQMIDSLASSSGSSQIAKVAVTIKTTSHDNAWNVSVCAHFLNVICCVLVSQE